MAELIEKLSLEEEEKKKSNEQVEAEALKGGENIDNNDDDEDGEDEEDEGNETAGATGEKKKKKRKNKKKKSAKKKGADNVPAVAPAADGSNLPHSRLLGGVTDYFIRYKQTNPPTRPVSELFPPGKFPVGEILPHGKTKYPNPDSSWSRQSEEEKRSECISVYFRISI
jgi:methionyl aminopeptidase